MLRMSSRSHVAHTSDPHHLFLSRNSWSHLPTAPLGSLSEPFCIYLSFCGHVVSYFWQFRKHPH